MSRKKKIDRAVAVEEVSIAIRKIKTENTFLQEGNP